LSPQGGTQAWQKVSLPTPLPLFARLQRSEGDRKGGGKRLIVYALAPTLPCARILVPFSVAKLLK